MLMFCIVCCEIVNVAVNELNGQNPDKTTHYVVYFFYLYTNFCLIYIAYLLQHYWNEKQKKYYTVATIPKSKRKIVERGKIDTPNTEIHDL